jgi:LysM repeat protein
MTFWAGFFRSAQCFLACAVLSGCLPASSSPLDEEKEPHFLAGKGRVSTLDYKGAIECFEKALQVNPQSASAHFELAWLFDVKEQDPAAAIYHYDHYLKLRSNAGNADLVKQRVMACKQALAETVSLGPVTEKMQRQFEQMTETNKCLLEENKQLREALEKWSSYAARLQTLTNPVVVQAQSPMATRAVRPIPATRISMIASTSASLATGAAGTSSPAVHTHTVKSGETPSVIARKYGVKLEALMSANPNLDPRRLRVGQILRIPAS